MENYPSQIFLNHISTPVEINEDITRVAQILSAVVLHFSAI